MKNRMLIKFDSVSENEGFARNVIASFLLPLNPGIGELTDVKTAVSEAVTNAIVHGYPDQSSVHGQLITSIRILTKSFYV